MAALPASHTVEVMFTLPPDFPHGGITNIPGVLMKQSEPERLSRLCRAISKQRTDGDIAACW